MPDDDETSGPEQDRADHVGRDEAEERRVHHGQCIGAVDAAHQRLRADPLKAPQAPSLAETSAMP